MTAVKHSSALRVAGLVTGFAGGSVAAAGLPDVGALVLLFACLFFELAWQRS